MSYLLSQLKPEHQRLAAWAVPLVAVLIAALVIFFPAREVSHYHAALVKTQATITAKEKVIKQAAKIAGGRPLAVAVVPVTEDEPVVFLRELTQLVAECQGKLISVHEIMSRSSASTSTSRPAAARRGGTDAPTMGRKIARRADVQEISNRVTLTATYPNLLLLLSKLENNRRILSLSQCRVQVAAGKGYPILQAMFVVSRYVWTGEEKQVAVQ